MLFAYDRSHNTKYSKTLLTYLLCERNAAKAARKLYLHRNTLRNHMDKILEIIDPDLNDPDFRFYLLVSLNTLLNSS